jgi:hypothetical protein
MSNYECDECGEEFETLSAKRIHEKDDCPGREQYAEIDPSSNDAERDAAMGALECRDCGRQNNTDYDQTPSFADGDFHLIVEFECQFCGFENENRIVMEGVDREDLDDLPEHLQPEEADTA